MSGVKGKSGRWTPESVLKKWDKMVKGNSEAIMQAYIDKAIEGNAQILVDLANRILGKPPEKLDIAVQGQLSADQVAEIYKAAYEQFQEQKQLPQHISSDNQE